MPRQDYEERKAARIERLENRAFKIRRVGEARVEAGSKMFGAIPFGQPILIGHHSEKRDRNYRNRAANNIDKGLELIDKANAVAAKAEAAESNTAISSDDPNAIDKLREKIEASEAKQANMKAINAAHKKYVKNPASLDKAKLSEADKALIRAYEPAYSWEPHPYPPYSLSNNNANIRRMKERIEHLEAEAKRAETAETRTYAGNGYKITEEPDDNRVWLAMNRKPQPEVTKYLRAHGWRWAPSDGVWKHNLNNTGRYRAKEAAKWLGENGGLL